MNAFNDAKIPTFLQQMTKLEDLSLKATGRTGIVPHWLGTMSSLVLLDLDTNSLHGTIPRVLGDLDNLKFLLLNRNQLSGSIPNSFEQLTKLGKVCSCSCRQISLFLSLPLTIVSYFRLFIAGEKQYERDCQAHL